jgi:peptidoglycan/xylan/chitin deacetylase (PgdA/CDA1 family)
LADSITPSAVRRITALVALALLALVCIPATAARAQTVVSLTFDDGITNQYNEARPQLAAHGMLATFFINSGNVGVDPYFMDWPQLDTLNAEHHEIAGHTISHVDLTTLTPDQQRHEICDDAATLRAHGYQIVDFAYPFGKGSATPTIRAALHDCGFASARKFGDLWGADCPDCPAANAIPPADPYALNTGFPANAMQVEGPLTLTMLQDWVTHAESNGGGWVPIVMHDVNTSGAAETISPATLKAFLDWLQPRAAMGTVVKTLRSVMGYPDFPATPAPPAPVHVAAADKITAFASLKAKKTQRVGKLRVTASMAEPGTLSAFGTVKLSKRFKLKKVSATALRGKLVSLRLKLSKKGLAAVKRALRHHKRVRAAITVVAKDLAGNVKTRTLTVTLRR